MRAGVYIKQPGGFKAFIPNPLPPSPPIEMDEELHKLLSNADRCLGRPANSILKKASELDLIKEVTGNKRNRWYRYEPYLELFSKPLVEF